MGGFVFEFERVSREIATRPVTHRRGYAERPPAVSPFSPHYPGNDERYTTYAHDLPVSLLQSAIRSIAHGRIEEHPALPRAESLKDCMERVTPYYVDTIQKALDERKNVLVASSENAIRGLLMHLCEIPEDRVPEIEIPTGIPMLFDFERRCVRLLDDGQSPAPRERCGRSVSSSRWARTACVPEPGNQCRHDSAARCAFEW